MNQRTSKESLDNDNDNCRYSSGSSTPTDFTSDDESTHGNNLFILNPKSLQKKQRNNEYFFGNKQQFENSSYEPLVYPRYPSDHKFEKILDSFIKGYKSEQPIEEFESDQVKINARSDTVLHPFTNYGGENMSNGSMNRNPYRAQLDLPFSTILRSNDESSEDVHNYGLSNRLCSQIYERCRSIDEAIEFVEINRSAIDGQIQILLEAPAYRNYNMSNYQLDYSIKESFNPNFWLDREPVVTTADGNCQYHAVSISLTGTEHHTSAVRLAAAVAVLDNRDWFNSILRLTDRGSVLDLVRTIARSFSWGDETTLKAIAIGIKRKIYLYSCNFGKKDFEMVMSLSKEELFDAFKDKKYKGGTGIHTYADPLHPVSQNDYIMLFHKSEHFVAVLPTSRQVTNYEPYNPIVPAFV